LPDKVLLRYRLPAERKSSVHEKLFGRRVPTYPLRRTRGLLSPYVVGNIYAGVYVRRKHLRIVKSILDSHDVTFDATPLQVKYSSLKRHFRRHEAKYVAYLKRSMRSYKRSSPMIKFIEHDLASHLQREPGADWYASYIRGKIASCVKARTSRAEKPRTVVKVIRSILRKKTITRSDVGFELRAVAEKITCREEADRLIRVAYQLGVSIYPLKGEPETLICEAAQALRMRLKRLDLRRLLPLRYSWVY
jgi:hypothetical protein